MASLGSQVTLSAPLRVARAWPWRVEDPSDASSGPSLPRLRAQCASRVSPGGRRVAAGGSAMELEITGDARAVSLVHGASHIVDRVFRFPAPVLGAVLAVFPRRRAERRRRRRQERGDDDQPPVVCVLSRADCVSVFAPNGESYEVALPFQADRLVALSPALGGGLLLQRRPLTPAPSAAATAAAFSPSHVRSPPGTMRGSMPAAPVVRPRYFTLAHPLEEVKPIALTPPRSTATRSRASFARQQQPSKTLTFLSDPALDLVSVCALPVDKDADQDDSDGRYGGGGGQQQQKRALMVCFHRHERRFAVYEMTRHVPEPSQDKRSEDNGGRSLALKADIPAVPSTPTAFVSPAKARQHQREAAMMEQYFKSHIVPDFGVRLVWTTPSLDVLAESEGKPAQSPATPRGHSRSAFLVHGGDEDKSEDGFSTGDEILYRLGIVDERNGLLLLKPVRLSDSQDEGGGLFRERENDLHVVRCQSASPLTRKDDEESPNDPATTATEVLVCTRDGAKLLLYRAGTFIAEVMLLDRGTRAESIRLCSSDTSSDGFTVRLATRHERSEYRRFNHPLRIENSSLLRSVMEVLRHVLANNEYMRIHVATLATAATRYSLNTPQRQAEYVKDDEWWSFQRVMQAIVAGATGSKNEESLEHGAPKKARSNLQREGSVNDIDGELISRVLQSEFAITYATQHTAVLASVGGLPALGPASGLKAKQESYLASLEGFEASTEIIGRLVTALHLLHEDLRLSLARQHDASSLARLLHEVCVSVDLHHLASYYCCQYSCLSSSQSLRRQSNHLSSTGQIDIPVTFDDDSLAPDIFRWLRERLQGSSSSGRSLGGGGSFEPVTNHVSSPPFPRLEGMNDWKQAVGASASSYPLWRTDAVCRVYELLFPEDDEDDDMQGKQNYDITRLTELMEFLTSDEVGKKLSLGDLPIGVRFVVLEAIRVYREDPPHDASELVCEYIGRRDLAGTFSAGSDELTSAAGSTTSGSLIESTRLKSGGQKTPADSELHANPEAREVPDGLAEVVVRSQRLFPSDQRLKEVARLLRSNRPLCLRLEKSSDMTDQDFAVQQQARLLLLCKRSMALSVARGMVTLGTFDMTTVQNQAWQLSVPALPLAGRTPPTHATVLLDVSGYAKELTHWPQFHNGCATGLRLPGKDLSSIVTRYWIKYHRPSASEFQRVATQGGRGGANQPSSTATARDIDEARAAHAGVLLGLGLNGHLKCLSMADVYNYLSISNEFITVAILLGMATTAARGRRKRVSSASAALQAARRRRRRERFAATAPDGATQDDNHLPTASQVADTDVDMEVTVPASAAQEAPLDEAPTKTPLAAGAGAELSLERSVSKMLCLHIPALLPPAFTEFSVPASTQTAALLGLGILYQGSGHRLMTELLLTEITRSPASPQFLSSQHSAGSSTSNTSSTPFDQHEGYSLAAGLGLGLVLLGRGGATAGDPGLADLGLEEKLYKYIVGGATQPFASTGGDTNANGSYLYRGRKWKPFGSGLSGSTRPGWKPGPSSGNRSGDSTKSTGDRSTWRGEYVNIGVTASGSALALAFMYMKSGNRSIASQLAVPDTLILLDYVRPDILLVRSLAKNLVLWDSIQPSVAWIERQEVPLQLREAYSVLRDYNGDGDVAAELPAHADVRSICESYANIVAGACFSIGLRFAGTGDSSARETLRRFVVHFRDMRSRTALLGTDIVVAATDRVTIERCLSVCAQSLALVDAGTGNLETLTLLRSINLRQRVDNELTYGNHMTLSMAIGLLFLGGGRATVSRSKDAIAALIVSLYPVSAMNTADNKHHLQAFRHLYTLAVDVSRHVETVETMSSEPCSVELRVESHQDGPNGTIVMKSSTLKTPCLLPEIDSIDRIIINSPDFYPVDIRLQDSGEDEGDGGAWGAGWSAFATKGTQTTANDNRVKLLLENGRILLERRIKTDHQSMVSASPLSQVGARGNTGREWHAYKQYFTTSSRARHSTSRMNQLGDDGATAWWQQRLASKQLPVQLSPVSLLPTHLSVLFEVFAMHHPRRRLDSLDGLWNLKLIHEFHRMDMFRSIEQRQVASQEYPGDNRQQSSQDDAKRDFVEWLRGQTEEALRYRWRHEASQSLPSLSAVQHALLDDPQGDSSSDAPGLLVTTPLESDSLLLSALYVFFDAPPTVFNNPTEWKHRMQRAMTIASSRSASRGASMTNFAVDRFLQPHTHEDQVTQEEQTFWLRAVSCFLFSV